MSCRSCELGGHVSTDTRSCDLCGNQYCDGCLSTDDSGSYCEDCVAWLLEDSLESVGGEKLIRAEVEAEREAREQHQDTALTSYKARGSEWS